MLFSLYIVFNILLNLDEIPGIVDENHEIVNQESNDEEKDGIPIVRYQAVDEYQDNGCKHPTGGC
jgi:hypothetical protein